MTFAIIAKLYTKYTRYNYDADNAVITNQVKFNECVWDLYRTCARSVPLVPNQIYAAADPSEYVFLSKCLRSKAIFDTMTKALTDYRNQQKESRDGNYHCIRHHFSFIYYKMCECIGNEFCTFCAECNVKKEIVGEYLSEATPEAQDEYISIARKNTMIVEKAQLVTLALRVKSEELQLKRQPPQD